MVNAPKDVQHVEYTWEQFDADVERIARAVEGSGKKFTHIYGLSRGGLTLAVCLSHRLGLEFARISFLPEMQITSAKLKETEPGVWIVAIAKPEGLLVVDDLSDTGAQLQPYRDRKFFIATIHKKPWTKVLPEICIREETRWIDYPWEKKGRGEDAGR